MSIRGHTDTSKAAFYYGLGIMGVLAGVGLGSDQGNKLALMVGLGGLYYANTLNPVVNVQPRPELQAELDSMRSRLPDTSQISRAVSEVSEQLPWS